MSLMDVIRKAPAIADKVTKALQPVVTYERADPLPDSYSTENYLPAVSLRALVEWKQMQERTSTGVMTVTRPIITFLNVAEVAAATGGLGFNTNDRLTLSDGTTGPIRMLDGALLDSGTNRPILTQVMLG